MKILILKPSSLGDVVHALPVLRLLKQHLPASEIYWWVETRNAGLLEGDPDLAGLSLFNRDRWATPWHWNEIWNSVRALRSQRFDLVIDLQALARSSAVGWLADGQRFIGLLDPRELAPAYYDVAVPRPSPQTHAVDWYLEVLRVLGIPVHNNFEWFPPRALAAAAVEERWQLSGKNCIALLPGARWDNKRWPAAYFRDLISQLHTRRDDLSFVILGGKPDHGLAKEISSGSPAQVLDLTGKTSLPETIEVLRQCRVVVTNDTGPMHVAAALKKSVVALFGPTNPARTGPYGQMNSALQRHDLPCVPCMKSSCGFREPLACLRGILPTQAAQVVLDCLGD